MCFFSSNTPEERREEIEFSLNISSFEHLGNTLDYQLYGRDPRMRPWLLLEIDLLRRFKGGNICFCLKQVGRFLSK